MSKVEERLQILKMIESGRITAAEGARLLEAIEAAGGQEQAEASGAPPRWFRVRVTDLHNGKNKVNINIPFGLVKVGMNMGAKFAPDMAGINLDDVMQAIKSGVHGKIIDVEDTEGGERVEIYAE
ncbi:MAG: SHOCT-like domain-containing protein [Anaerolineae bacterium]